MDMPNLGINSSVLEGLELEVDTFKKSVMSESSHTLEESVVLLGEVENSDSFLINEIEVADEDIHYVIASCEESNSEELISSDKFEDDVQDKTEHLIVEEALNDDNSEIKPLKCDTVSEEGREEQSIVNRNLNRISDKNRDLRFRRKLTASKSYKLTSQQTSGFKRWDSRLTKSLIEIRKEMDFSFKFRKDKNHNTLLWNNVLKQLIKTNSNSSLCPQLTWIDCADKWRSLLMTYKINLMKYKQYGENSVTWDFFNDIHEWMRNDNSSEFSRLIKGSVGLIKNPVPKKKFRIEQTLEKVPLMKVGNSVTITKKANPSSLSNVSCNVINQTATEAPLIFTPGVSMVQTPSADYHFAMLIVKELEKLAPDIKKQKKQQILLALYE